MKASSSAPCLSSPSSSSSSNLLKVAWQRYLYQLNKRPLRTKALTAACIAAISDIIAQRILTGGYKSGRRTLAVACYGLLYSGPGAHYWQKFVQWLFCTCGRGSRCNCSSASFTVAKKVDWTRLHTAPRRPSDYGCCTQQPLPSLQLFVPPLLFNFTSFSSPLPAGQVVLDQVTYGPMCNLLFILFTGLVLEARSASDVATKLVRNYPTVQLNGWRVWPLAAFVNYRFVPVQFRVLFINIVALGWSTFLLMRARVQSS